METEVRNDKHNAKYLEVLRNKNIYSAEQMSLIEEDLNYGLECGQVEMYLNKSYNLKQMRAISDCLKRDYPSELIKIIKNLDAGRMETAVEYYCKGIALADLIKVVNESADAMMMRRNLKLIYEKIKAAASDNTDKEEYVTQLMETVASVVKRVDEQTERYEEYQKQLSEAKSKESKELSELYKNLSNKDEQIRKLNQRITESEQTIKTLEAEREVKTKEAQTKEVQSKEANTTGVEETRERKDRDVISSEMPAGHGAERYEDDDMKLYQKPVRERKALEVPLQAAKEVTPIDMRDIQVETTTKKSNAVFEVVSRLFSKKRSTYNLIKNVTEKRLSAAQIGQIKIALLVGLSEKKLNLLINPEMPPELMGEIIEVAKAAKEAGWED